MQAANFSLQDGRDPLSQLDSERRAHQMKLDKLVEEMNQVYVEKVILIFFKLSPRCSVLFTIHFNKELRRSSLLTIAK